MSAQLNSADFGSAWTGLKGSNGSRPIEGMNFAMR